jgi:hypothetical protein
LFAVGASPALAQKPDKIGKIERIDPAFDDLVAKDVVIEVLAEGF